MNSLRLTETNSADDSKGRTWGLEGNLFWYLAGGSLVSVIILLVLFSMLKVSFLASLLVAAIPLVLTLAYVFLFRQGKPPVMTAIAWTSGSRGLVLVQSQSASPNTPMFEESPNGFFMRDLLVFGGLQQGGYVSKGFVFQPPDLNNAEAPELNAFQDQISLFLASLSENQRLQVQWFCDSDYRAELLRYQKETDRATNPWTKRCRNERFTRYWQAILDRRLRRERLVLYISRAIEASPKGLHSKAALCAYYDALLEQMQAEFVQVNETLINIFSGQCARVLPMSDADHYRHFAMFLNPSLTERFDYDPLGAFDPNLSIQENCWHSQAAGQADFGFFMDGAKSPIARSGSWAISGPNLPVTRAVLGRVENDRSLSSSSSVSPPNFLN